MSRPGTEVIAGLDNILKAEVRGKAKGDFVIFRIDLQRGLICLWVSCGVELNELQVLKGEFDAVLEYSFPIHDVCVKAVPS